MKAFWTVVGATCSVLVASIGVVYLVQDWHSIPDEWKAFYISASGYHVIKAVKSFAQFQVDVKRWWANAREYVLNGRMDEMLAEVQVDLIDIDSSFASCVSEVGEETAAEIFYSFTEEGETVRANSLLAESLPESMGQQVAATGRCSKFLAKLTFMNVLGVVVGVIAVVALAIQIVKEWNTEQRGLIALDILGTVCTIFETGAFTCSLLDIGYACTFLGLANVIPLVGQVAAVLGLVFFAIAAYIRHQKLDPVQSWVKDHGKAVLNRVTVPTHDWLNKHPGNYGTALDGEYGQDVRIGHTTVSPADDFRGLVDVVAAREEEPAVDPRQVCCGLWPFHL